MTRYEVYSLIVCIVVFILLTALLTGLIGYIVKLLLRSIKGGLEDEKIKIEYFSTTAKRKSKALSIIDKAFSAIVFLCFFALFIGTMFVNIAEKSAVGNVPRLQVVCSESMSKKHSKNTYLAKNNLHDQFDMFDVIVTYRLPAETELKQYDIVVYEIDDILVVHRIVNIEEPNEKHPNERHFLLQGDNVDSPDKFPVLYSQMRGIYRGEKIPFVGSIVLFFQSPAGYLSILLVVYAMIASPILERILKKAKYNRLEEILLLLAETRTDIANTEGFEAKMAILAEEYRQQKKKSPRTVEKTKETSSRQDKIVAPEKPNVSQTKSSASLSKSPTNSLLSNSEASEPAFEPLPFFDPFIETLTAAERTEFISFFVGRTVLSLPEYVIGGDNKLFFRMLFIYLGTLRSYISNSLMEKIYQHTAKLHR